MDAKELLDSVAGISKKYDAIYQKTGGYFNIFEITNIAEDEVKICRILYELLNPRGAHYQGTRYLRLFLEKVLHIKMLDEELESAEVFREYPTKNGRRIDLVIKTVSKFIPIEVKINAEDQEEQCADYIREAKPNSVLYYLTTTGYSPSDASVKGLTDAEKENIIQISFKDDIINWLEACVCKSDTLKIAPIREVLFQLISAIKKFTNQMENDKSMEIENILMESAQSMKSSVEISEALPKAKAGKMLELFKAIESKVQEKYGYKRENVEDFSTNDNKNINDFDKNKKSTYPSINFSCRKYVKNLDNEIFKSTDVWIRIEIDWCLFIGYCFAKDGKQTRRKNCPNEEKYFKEHFIPGLPQKNNDFFVYWEYLSAHNEKIVHDKKEAINFKDLNSNYYELYDRAKFDRLVEACADKIHEFMEK